MNLFQGQSQEDLSLEIHIRSELQSTSIYIIFYPFHTKCRKKFNSNNLFYKGRHYKNLPKKDKMRANNDTDSGE